MEVDNKNVEECARILLQSLAQALSTVAKTPLEREAVQALAQEVSRGTR